MCCMRTRSYCLYVLTTNFGVCPRSPQQSARELHHCAVSSWQVTGAHHTPTLDPTSSTIIYHHLPVLTPCSSASRPFSSCCFLSLSISFISGYPKTEHKRRAVVCLQTMACRSMLLQPFASASVALLRRHGACLGTNAECVRTNLH